MANTSENCVRIYSLCSIRSREVMNSSDFDGMRAVPVPGKCAGPGSWVMMANEDDGARRCHLYSLPSIRLSVGLCFIGDACALCCALYASHTRCVCSVLFPFPSLLYFSLGRCALVALLMLCLTESFEIVPLIYSGRNIGGGFSRSWGLDLLHSGVSFDW